MNIKKIFVVLLVVFILVSCAPSPRVVPLTQTAIPMPTLTVTLTPSATPTITPTSTLEPTPSGGGTLKVAFYGHDVHSQFLMVGDYFTGKIDYKIPVDDFFKNPRVSWSPNGSYLLFVDTSRLPTGVMKVNLLNIKTGKVLHLSSHPATGNHWWNTLDLLKWSPDGQHVMYDPRIDNDSFSKVYVASTDGTVQIVEGSYSDWLPDSRTIVSILNDGSFEINSIFDTIKEDTSEISIPKLKTLNIDTLSREYIFLDAAGRDKLEGIRYPEDLGNNTLWQLDTLLANKITLLTFSPEIKNSQITIDFIQDLPNKKLAVMGRCSCAEGSYFGTVVDGEDLPAIVTNKNLYSFTDEYFPIAFSPDSQLVLLGRMILDDHRNVTAFPGLNVMPWYVRFIVKSISGQEINVSDNLSQFDIEDTSVSNGGWTSDPYGGSTYLNGIDFYWQP